MNEKNARYNFIDWNNQYRCNGNKWTRSEQIDYYSWSYDEADLEWFGHQLRGLQIGGKSSADAEKALRKCGKNCPLFVDLLRLDSKTFRLEATKIIIRISLVRRIPYWSELWSNDLEYRWVYGYLVTAGFASIFSKVDREYWETSEPYQGFVDLFMD